MTPTILPPPPLELTRNPRRAAIVFALVVLGFVVASALDPWAYTALWHHDAESQDWSKALRSLGYWPTWITVGIIFFLLDRRRTSFAWPLRDRWTRVVLLIVTTGLASLIAELLKLITRRVRPELSDGVYVFRAITDRPLSTGGLGLPSSHTAMAFAAALILARLHPPAAPIFLIAAVGCGLTRVVDRAHYVSDVYAGGLVAWAVVAWLWAWHARNARRDAEPATMSE